MAAFFGAKDANAEAEARNDVFSKQFDGGVRLRKGDAGYGRAVARGARIRPPNEQFQGTTKSQRTKPQVRVPKHAQNPR